MSSSSVASECFEPSCECASFERDVHGDANLCRRCGHAHAPLSQGGYVDSAGVGGGGASAAPDAGVRGSVRDPEPYPAYSVNAWKAAEVAAWVRQAARAAVFKEAAVTVEQLGMSGDMVQTMYESCKGDVRAAIDLFHSFGLAMPVAVRLTTQCRKWFVADSAGSDDEVDAAAPAVPASPGGVLRELTDADLTFGCQLGRGAFGTVFEVDYHGSPAVAKLLRAGNNDELLRESRLLMDVQSANVVHMYCVGMYSGAKTQGRRRAVLVMERAEGSLVDAQNAGLFEPPHGWVKVAALVLDVARGLLVLHRSGILHRDVRLPNVLVFHGMSVAKLSDLGIGRVTGEQSRLVSVLSVGPEWHMAPESLSMGEFSAASDVYMLGVVMFELLSGEAFFAGVGRHEIAGLVRGGRRPDVSRLQRERGVPGAFVALVESCWAHAASARPSVEVVMAQLEELVALGESGVPRSVGGVPGDVSAVERMWGKRDALVRGHSVRLPHEDGLVLVKVLRECSNAGLVARVLELVFKFARNDENRRWLGERGACEVVVAAMTGFRSDRDVVCEGCMAVVNLTYNNDENQRRLGECGACEAVVEAMSRFSSDRDVAEQGCWAVVNLSCNNDENKRRLGECGACEAVVEAMSRFSSDRDVVYRGCWAVVNLTYIDDDNKLRLGECGACEAVVAAMTRFNSDRDVVLQSSRAAFNLTFLGENKGRLHRCGAPALLRRVLQSPALSNAHQDARDALNRLT